MAAGAAGSWHPSHSSKYSTSPTGNMLYDTSHALEYTQELHYKMSKKIAQLTKVRIHVTQRLMKGRVHKPTEG